MPVRSKVHTHHRLEILHISPQIIRTNSKVGCHKRVTTDEPSPIPYPKQPGVIHSIDARPSSLFHHCFEGPALYLCPGLSGSITSLMAPSPVYNTFLSRWISVMRQCIYLFRGGEEDTRGPHGNGRWDTPCHTWR